MFEYRASPPHLRQISISILKTRFNRFAKLFQTPFRQLFGRTNQVTASFYISQSRLSSVTMAERLTIVLLAAKGRSMGTSSRSRVSSDKRQGDGEIIIIILTWRMSRKMHRSRDARKKLTSSKVNKVNRLTKREKPQNATHRRRRLMAEQLNMSNSGVGRIWCAHGMNRHRVSGVKLSNDK